MEHQPLKSPVGKKAMQIWDAYQEALKELEAKDTVSNTGEVSAARRREQAIQAAESLDVDQMTGTLEDLSMGMLEAMKTFQELNVAIAEKKTELQKVHQLEYQANAAVALAAAKDKMVADREAQAERIISEAEERQNTIIEDTKRSAENIKKTTDLLRDKADEERKRAEEQWAYAFARKKQMELDSIQDEIDAKNKALDVREEHVAGREETIQDLDTTIMNQAAQLKAQESNTLARIEAAVEQAKSAANKSAAIQKQIIDGKHQGDLAVLQSQNDSLSALVTDLRDRLTRAEEQVQAANGRVTDIATSAFKRDADAATVAKVSEIAAGSGKKQ